MKFLLKNKRIILFALISTLILFLVMVKIIHLLEQDVEGEKCKQRNGTTYPEDTTYWTYRSGECVKYDWLSETYIDNEYNSN